MPSSTVINTEPSIAQLENAFVAFNKVSADLGTYYKGLELKVSELNAELESSHSERIKELTEKARLAARLSALMDALPGGVLVLDKRGSVLQENAVANGMLGVSTVRKNWCSTLRSLDCSDTSLDSEFTLSNGKRIAASYSPYGDDEGTIVLLTDVSESHRINLLANREQRLTALGEMAARLAHQIRTPLSAAILYLSHLATLLRGHKNSKGTVKKVLSHLQQIENLVEGLLSYIRGDSNEKHEFCLASVIREARDATLPKLDAVQGTIHFRQFDRSEYRIWGDRAAFFNALTNLIENAAEATRASPEININLKTDSGQYVIEVGDNGAGIADSIRNQIFDPFFSTRTHGTGLGLAVVSSVIKAHNGKIEVTDSDQGGALFRITIPPGIEEQEAYSGIWSNAIEHTKPESI